MAVASTGGFVRIGLEVGFWATTTKVDQYTFVAWDITKENTVQSMPGTAVKPTYTTGANVCVGVALEGTNPDVMGNTRALGTDIGEYKPQIAVQMAGIALVRANAAITRGHTVRVGPNGRAATSGVGQRVGYAMNSVAANELVSVWLSLPTLEDIDTDT